MDPRVPLVAIVLLVGGCAEDDEEPSTSSTPATSSSRADVAAGFGESIDIGDRSLWLECWGERVPGEPTVLLVSGQGPTVSYWQVMAADLAGDGHYVCGYDRAGVGGSEAATEPTRTTDDQVRDLVALLDAADLEEPVVVVAHSLGSLPAIGVVDRAPERVAGVVLVDPWAPRVSATTRAALPPRTPHESPALAEERRFLDDFMFDPAQNPEHLLLATCDKESVRLLDEPGPVFGDLPVVVLQAPLPKRPAGIPRDYDAIARAAWVEGNQELAHESTRGEVIEVEDTGHDIHVDQPEIVMDAILDMLAG